MYLEVPVYDHDRIIVPPLEGFVMNRVLGDYFETLLYKIFVSIDEHTSVKEASNRVANSAAFHILLPVIYLLLHLFNDGSTA